MKRRIGNVEKALALAIMALAAYVAFCADPEWLR